MSKNKKMNGAKSVDAPETSSSATETSSSGGGSKNKNVRKTSDLLGGSKHDKVFALGRAAFAIVNTATGGKSANKKTGQAFVKGSFKGVPALAKTKFPNGAWYSKTKAGGPFWKAPEDGKHFQACLEAARSAKEDIADKKNSGSLHQLLSAIMDIPGQKGGGGGARKTDWARKLDL